MRLLNKNVIYSITNESEDHHIGEYFQIVSLGDKYYLYYCCLNTIKLVISNNLCFLNKDPITVITEAPGGCFCIIKEDNRLFMLCGCHVSNKEQDELAIPDLVWPQEKRTLTDYNTIRVDRKNGMYLLSSSDGIQWKQLHDKPVLHSFVSSESCRLGEVAFDTSPFVIKNDNEFYYYGRLNTSLDERRIYLRKSTDLINWTEPQKIDIVNESENNSKKNYYNAVMFKHDENFHMFTPYFESCGTKNRVCNKGRTLWLKSKDGLTWKIMDYFLPHEGKYKDRINDVRIENNTSPILFYRENIPQRNQDIVSFSLGIKL